MSAMTTYCRKCGYNLTDVSESDCPGCGGAIDAVAVACDPRHRGVVLLMIATICCAVVAYASIDVVLASSRPDSRGSVIMMPTAHGFARMTYEFVLVPTCIVGLVAAIIGLRHRKRRAWFVIIILFLSIAWIEARSSLIDSPRPAAPEHVH